jgi:hypothetical protein
MPPTETHAAGEWTDVIPPCPRCVVVGKTLGRLGPLAVVACGRCRTNYCVEVWRYGDDPEPVLPGQTRCPPYRVRGAYKTRVFSPVVSRGAD